MTASIVTFALVNALIFASLRYRLAFEPCLIMMAGLGWASVLGWKRAPQEPPRPAAG
jgi:hypothetical protein